LAAARAMLAVFMKFFGIFSKMKIIRAEMHPASEMLLGQNLIAISEEIRGKIDSGR
jgi:hypothetical protein